MKKIVVLTLAVLFIATNVYADKETTDGMKERASRGFCNFFTGLVEVPVQINKGYNNGFDPIDNEFGSKTVGTVLGFFRGFSHAYGRMASGATELFFFWAASPASNEGVGIPLDAEKAWEEGTQYSIFDPSLSEGIKPIGRKIVRGLGNGLFGILEVPGQLKKGTNEGEALAGLGRGVWYWFSRSAYGMSDIYSGLVPNPVDNKGVHFYNEWPWEALGEE